MRILDFGSGNTCKNNLDYGKRMIDELAEVDPERKFIIKWQLFKEAGNNIPLSQDMFYMLYNYAEVLGYKTTASAFDSESLKFLLQFDIPFVKIANRQDLYWLIGEVPRKILVLVSCTEQAPIEYKNSIKRICCISKYPTTIKEYEEIFTKEGLNKYGISDHTTNWDLYLKYWPEIYECHYKLKDSTGLDAGDFARTPEQIKENYNEL